MREAAQLLCDNGKHDEAIDLCSTDRDYARAGEIAEKMRDWKRAAQLYFRGGDFIRAARARLENKEPMLAAELFERTGDFASAAQIFEHQEDFVRASTLYERGGDKQRAADLLVRAISSANARVIGPDADEACRRAGVLYAEIGLIDMAVRVLKFGRQNLFAGKLLARAGRFEEAIALLAQNGDYLAAAELARASGNERGAHVLLGERAEKEGQFAEAAMHYSEAELFPRAARLYEYAGDTPRAAEAYERAQQYDSAAEMYAQIAMFADAARCLRAVGREHDAVVLEESAGLRDDTITAHALRGELLQAAEGALAIARSRDASRYQEAAAYLSRIPSENPDWLRARTLLAEVLADQGDTRGAIGVLGAVLTGITFDLGHVPPLYQYGRLLEIEGYLAQARQAYRMALELDPTFRDLAERMAMLGESNSSIQRMAPVRTVTGVGMRAPSPRHQTPAGGVPIAPMVVLPQMVATAPAQTPPPTPPPKEEPARPSSLVGVVLRGRFRIESKLGRGAQAEVYRARDLVLDRPVAIKVLSETGAQDKQALDRFLREARLAARVNHATCIAIYDFGVEHGVTFMAMEYFKGKTLRDRLAEAPMDPLAALVIARDVAEALGAVHAAGIVHRDIKPTNVMVDDNGRARLTDFGVAKDGTEEPVAGVMVGTIKYMSPEQARGKDVDGRSDIFSLGVMMYELLTGRAPFGGTLDALIKRVKEPPPTLPQDLAVPELLRSIVSRCLQKKRDSRYPTVQPLVDHLRICMAELRGVSQPNAAAISLLPALVPDALPPPLPPPDAEDMISMDL